MVNLEVLEAGEGPVTVVLEAGLTGSAHAWASYLPRLAPHARVIAVSRAGYGASPPAPTRSAEVMVDELDATLDRLQVTRPLVLVGHSWGGIVCRLLAARRPVDGLVLVDATHEGLAHMRSAKAAVLGQLAMLLAETRAWTGLTRRSLKNPSQPLAQTLTRQPLPLRTLLLEEMTSPSTWRQARRDMPTVRAALRHLSENPLPPLECPVVAVVGGHGTGRAQEIRMMMRSTYDAWVRTQPQARLVIAPHSGHLVPFDDEDLLVNEIARAIETAERRFTAPSVVS